jgi:hypothetical protein
MGCKCNDPSVTYLNDLGFNVIRVPRQNIEPLQMLGKQKGDVSILGTIDQVIVSSTEPLPAITAGAKMAQIRGQRTQSISLKEGLSLMDNILTAMGAGGLGMSIDLGWARSLSFEFDDVELDSVMPLDVGNYLRAADVDLDNLVVKEYVRGRGKLFLLSEVLRSSSIIVDFQAQDHGTTELNLPSIQGVASADLKVEEVRGRETAIRFEGPEKLAFGFKAMRIGVAQGRLRCLSSKPGAAYLSAGDEGVAENDDPGVMIDEDTAGGLLDL